MPTPAKPVTQEGLRTLREELFRLQLDTLKTLIDHGIDPGLVALVADISRTLEVVQQLRAPPRDRA
jgi:hypothetical protein